MNHIEEKAFEVYPVIIKRGFQAEHDVNLLTRRGFIKGYKQAEKDLGWISVKDRLPEENKWVFVCVDMQGVPQCVGLGYLRDGEWCDDENDNGFCVDYWMEIPKLPKEAQK